MQSKSLLLLALILSGHAFAQTKLIAYRSHSGNMNYFTTAEPDNLGNPPMMFDTLFLINDSMMIRQVSREGSSNHTQIDTITNSYYCKKPQVYADSARVPWSYETVIIKEKNKDKKKPAAENVSPQDEKQKEGIIPVEPNDNNQDGLQPAQGSMMNYFLLSLSPLLIFMGGFIWFVNRSKMLSSE